MQKPTVDFLKAGLEHYPAAVEAVSQFEDRILEKLTVVVDRFFAAHNLPAAKGRPREEAESEEGFGYWIYVEKSLGKDKEGVVLGLWWDAPELPEAPYFLYARLSNGKGLKQADTFPEPPIEYREMQKNKYYLVRQPPLEDIEELGARLLEKLIVQIK